VYTIGACVEINKCPSYQETFPLSGLVGIESNRLYKVLLFNIAARNVNVTKCQHYLKGQCHEIFRFWFFSSISFPPAPEYPIKTVSNFFENSRRYSQLKIDHRCR
jgi:hypothetical protein